MQASPLRSPLGRRPASPRGGVASSPTKGAMSSHAQQLLEIKWLREQLHEIQTQMQVLKGEKEGMDQPTMMASPSTTGTAPGTARMRKIPRAVAPAVFSLTDEGAKERNIATSMGRHVSIATGQVLRAIPKQLPNRVAERVAEAFVNPLKAIAYLNSYEFSSDLLAMAHQVSAIFENEPRCVPIQSPAYVIGDIHGNLADLKFFSDHLWRLGIGLTAGNFLFLGDYVDRGLSSLECIAYLFAQKIMHPNKVTMLRGNHETRAVNGWEEHYGAGSFLAQCKKRFGNDEGCIVWHQVNNAFDCMPVSAVIDDDIFCVHGGIPRPIESERQVDSIQNIPRLASFDTLGKASVFTGEHATLLQMAEEMLWADPAAESQETFLDKRGFGKSARGGNSICFGNVAIDDFLSRHNFSYIIRAHEACSQGVHLSKSARVLTVFSTSKDHGLGKRAKCGCVLVDRDRILILNRSHKYKSGFVRRRSSVQAAETAAATGSAPRRSGGTTAATTRGGGSGGDGSDEEDSTDDEVEETKTMLDGVVVTAGGAALPAADDNNQEES
ncbi:Aste57867_14482 [Aphanomyces stellatus]|uniref:Serine/threonine-protein phosphatase n=1 Tax=Aphanomyces stellatus TaxID=120398 RepID=A0A485L1L2_9STRA|nr:hypothetical protein As57867_014428 [Aphanomyces stellatus]VFT91304.1 Aste57867_14482 [Aphanomyces stellatus]